MILFLYNLALLAVLVIASPWWLWKMATAEKYRDLSKRFGQLPENLVQESAPPGPQRQVSVAGVVEPQVVWLHAVSVGEVLAVTRLVQELDAAFPGYRIVISTTTRTGQALARQRFGVERVFYCPLDLPWAVSRVMNALQPKMLILAETEFWPNLLAACYRRNIPVVVVNARISDRSWPRYRGLRRLWKPFLSRLSAVLAQSTLDAERLHAIGCSNVSIAGNLKFDVRAPQESDATRLLKALAPRPRFLVAGSTLEGEEAAFLSSNLRLSLAGMNPLLITVLAPRHPDRFNEVARLLEQSGVRWVRRSAWQGKTLEDIEPLHGGEVVLLDTIGELASVYSLATVAFVGGSLVAAGGHNPLEPAQFAVPIVMGPHYANFRAITDDLIAHNAIRIAAPEQLATVLVDLLNDRQSAQALGARARHVFEQQSGATARCVASIRALLPNHAQASAPQPVAAERNV